MRLAFALCLAVLFAVAPARADDDVPDGLGSDDILGPPRPYFRLESAVLRTTFFDQRGHGFQSRAGPRGGPGSETMWVGEPELEVVVGQGEHVTHRIWIPVDLVSAASPDAIDVVSTASRRNESGAFDWTATYKRGNASVSIRNGFHNEENYRSWNTGFAATLSLADDNTVLAASLNQVLDWFDHYLIGGEHAGHSARSASNVNFGVTQLLSPTTVVNLNYGYTVQKGVLTNGWNIVPLTTGGVELELLPELRDRHAIVGRISQYLPWDGALKASYRFYADDWSIDAHTVEVEVDQRISPVSYLGATYRVHHQTAASFFTTRTPPDSQIATADSDLDAFVAQTLGVKGVIDMYAGLPFAKTVHFDVAVERYFRSNDLAVNVFSCALGLYP